MCETNMGLRKGGGVILPRWRVENEKWGERWNAQQKCGVHVGVLTRTVCKTKTGLRKMILPKLEQLQGENMVQEKPFPDPTQPTRRERNSSISERGV